MLRVAALFCCLSSVFAALEPGCYSFGQITADRCGTPPNPYMELVGPPGPPGAAGKPGKVPKSFEARMNAFEHSLNQIEGIAREQVAKLTPVAESCWDKLYTYKIVTNKLSFAEAKNNCERLGGQLAHHGIFNLFERSNVILSNGGIINNGNYWIGMTDADSEGEWKYLDGRAVDMGKIGWAYGEPNGNRNENCAVTWSTERLNDVPCSYRYKSICEFKTCSA